MACEVEKRGEWEGERRVRRGEWGEDWRGGRGEESRERSEEGEGEG